MTRSHVVLALLGFGALVITGAASPDRLPLCARGAFVGITETQPDGTIIGRPDDHDWGCAGEAGANGGVRGRASALGVPSPPPPQALCFEPAAPNPASGATRLQFAVPVAGHVNLVIYGRDQRHGPRETFVARTLVDGTLAVGFFTSIWDMKDDQGARVAPGLYRAVLEAGGETLCGDIEVQ